MSSEYAQSGVDYTKIEPFKQAMKMVGRLTLGFPNKRGVVVESFDHGTVFYYDAAATQSKYVRWSSTQEGLGNKNWISEWMYQNAGTGRTYYEGIGIDAAMMAVNDLIACGAMPVVYTDEVAAGDSEWFQDGKRAKDLADSYYRACKLAGMALPAGESPALKYLVKAELPVKSAPSLSGCVTGIIEPRTKIITGEGVRPGSVILGVPSSGLHANGISLVIKRALGLKDQFLTKVGDTTLGDQALIPTTCYVDLVEELMKRGGGHFVQSFIPGTGGGVAKVAFDKRPFTYRIHSWVKEVPPLFQFMLELGVSLKDCLETFNWGIGYYIITDPLNVETIMKAGHTMGYEIMEIGRVEEGERKVIFEPEGITLPPPGE